MCEIVPLIPAMSQAVLLSEAYGEKVTSCFILISIITLWRASSYCCLSLSPALPHSVSLILMPFPASDFTSVEARQCLLYWICKREIQVRRDKVMTEVVVEMSEPLLWSFSQCNLVPLEVVQPQKLPFRCSSATCLTPINPVRPAVAAGFKPTVAERADKYTF